MQQTYQISGITCAACEFKIKYLFKEIEGVDSVEVDMQTGQTQVFTQKNIPAQAFEAVLAPYPKYKIIQPQNVEPKAETPASFLQTYRPLLLIFGYISAVSVLVAAQSLNGFDLMLAMRGFMAGFFLVFSFFKLLDVRAFAESYAMYDIVAKRFPLWGYLYVFTELGLGIAYLVDFQPFYTNLFTLVLMSVSLVGVVQSVLNKQKIRCACLGTVFNLPMSTVTIIEDSLMIAMSVGMLFFIR
jgi:copper chaperone CopZ